MGQALFNVACYDSSPLLGETRWRKVHFRWLHARAVMTNPVVDISDVHALSMKLTTFAIIHFSLRTVVDQYTLPHPNMFILYTSGAETVLYFLTKYRRYGIHGI